MIVEDNFSCTDARRLSEEIPNSFEEKRILHSRTMEVGGHYEIYLYGGGVAVINYSNSGETVLATIRIIGEEKSQITAGKQYLEDLAQNKLEYKIKF